MGNHISNPPSMTLILPDGTLKEYPKPVTAAEVMLDHPQQVVVEFRKGAKPTPLSADTKLESRKVYMTLPIRRGKPVGASISSDESRRLLLRANAILSSRSSFFSAYTGFLPMFAKVCPAAVVTMTTTKGKKERLPEKPSEVKPAGGLLGEMVERGEYLLSTQVSVKGAWKPSLDTIKEKGVKAKIRHWLL